MNAPMVQQRWRHWLIVGILILAALGLSWRMIQLMVVQRDFLQKQGNARSLRVIDIPASRGTIYDRHGEPLAISTPVASAAINPQEIDLQSPALAQLATLLDTSVDSLRQRIGRHQQREFLYLKRMIDPWLAKQITALDIPGVFLQPERRRYYPSGEVTVHALGFTNIDDRGQEGVELAFEDWLHGEAGKKRVIKDRLGHVVEDLDVLRDAKPGHDLVLSLDKRIQYAAYKELQTAVQKNQATSGSIVVLDVHSGEVLAMANQPSFNPNDRPRQPGARSRNRAVTDVFEPGSVVKPFSVALALASGKYQANTVVDTSPGWINLSGNRVRDEHPQGKIDVTTILQKSSNVGIAKLVLSLEPNHLWEMFDRIGFGVRTASGFPGESAGKLTKRHKWHPFTVATMSFGYGMSVTALQLAQAYAMLATDGIKYPVSFLRLSEAPQGQRLLEKDVAQSILNMLEAVVEGGTGKRAKVPGYRVTGKTGTVRMVGPQGYMRNHHTALFVGVAPASAPRLVTVVVINDPQAGAYYGGVVAAPVFSKVMAKALRMLDVVPDRLVKKG